MSDRPDIAALATVAREVAAEWRVELGERFALALHSYAAPAGDDGVLKVVPERHWESDYEADALAHWGGDGAARLLRRDLERRAFLIERARPGTDISGLPDAEATAIAVDVGQRLWRPAGAPFLRVADVLPRWLEEGEGELRARAEELLRGMKLRHDVQFSDGSPLNAQAVKATMERLKREALAPIVAPRLTIVGRNSLLRMISARGLVTLVKTQDGPQNTPSSSVTPE